MGSDIERAAELLDELDRSGALSPEASAALLGTKAAPREIGSGLGDVSRGHDLLLATILVDDSPSVYRLVPYIRGGHARMLRSLQNQEGETEVLVLTRAFNRGVLSPYRGSGEAMALTATNYDHDRLLPYTPLYKQALLTLATTMAKAREAERNGADVRTFTLILTDGQDNPDPKDGSRAVTATEVRAIVNDMLAFATNHIVAGMGVGEIVNWHQVFESMGIPKDWIFDAGATVEELDKIFERISKRLALAASSKAGFLELTAGNYPDVRQGSD